MTNDWRDSDKQGTKPEKPVFGACKCSKCSCRKPERSDGSGLCWDCGVGRHSGK